MKVRYDFHHTGSEKPPFHAAFTCVILPPNWMQWRQYTLFFQKNQVKIIFFMFDYSAGASAYDLPQWILRSRSFRRRMTEKKCHTGIIRFCYTGAICFCYTGT